MEKYIQLLKKNNLKITHQRLTILKYLDEHRTHPTADQIYTRLKQTNPSLSKTTVYNALETLAHHHIIQTITITSSEKHFDFRRDMHHHFLCRICGTITDINICCPNIETISKLGYKIEEVHGYFKGICKNCLKKTSNELKSTINTSNSMVKEKTLLKNSSTNET